MNIAAARVGMDRGRPEGPGAPQRALAGRCPEREIGHARQPRKTGLREALEADEISSLQNGIAFYERTSSFVSRVHPEEANLPMVEG
jgi:hypothetical protein